MDVCMYIYIDVYTYMYAIYMHKNPPHLAISTSCPVWDSTCTFR